MPKTRLTVIYLEYAKTKSKNGKQYQKNVKTAEVWQNGASGDFITDATNTIEGTYTSQSLHIMSYLMGIFNQLFGYVRRLACSYSD